MAKLPVRAFGTAEAVLVSRPLTETVVEPRAPQDPADPWAPSDEVERVVRYGELSIRGAYSVTVDATSPEDTELELVELSIRLRNEVREETDRLDRLDVRAALVLLEALETLRDGGILR